VIVRAWPALLVLVACETGGALPPVTAPPPTREQQWERHVPLSKLGAREQREFLDHTRSLLAPCPNVAVPVEQCVFESRDCRACKPAAVFVFDRVRHGTSPGDVTKLYEARFDPRRVVDVPVDGSPAVGPEKARITIVEFGDFECPTCKLVVPVLDGVRAKHESDVRLVYKVRLIGHPHGEIAAQAALAAREQGKFWEMHHKIFENQNALEESDLLAYASSLGLDPKRLRADMDAPAVKDRIVKDGALGDKLGADSTPTIFVNGRLVSWSMLAHDPAGALEAWVAQELAE
jgi:protein-disulfide isomerase